MDGTRLRLAFHAVVIVFLSYMTAWAQAVSTAQINGTVKNQAGLPLPGVTITVMQIDTGLTRSTVTDDTGSYVLQNLPIGPYRFDATLAVTLEVGQVQETVSVRGARRSSRHAVPASDRRSPTSRCCSCRERPAADGVDLPGGRPQECSWQCRSPH